MGIFDAAKDSIFRALREHNPSIPDGDFEKILDQVNQKIASEPPPKVAIIGESGVGKTSTLNALFNAGLEISHTEACTQEAAEIRVPLDMARDVSVESVEADQGDLIVYDMPGLGESQRTRDKHLATYRDVLSRADAALWILDAPKRAIEFVQTEISALDPRLTKHMTIALNKVDTVHPDDGWYDPANLPSPEQEANIQLRIKDVRAKIKEAIPDWSGEVIGYSARRRYNLPQLFAAMLDGVAKERRWVLAQRKSLADFFEYVDPRLLPADALASNSRTFNAAPVTRGNGFEHVDARQALSALSPEEFARISRDRGALDAWLTQVMERPSGRGTTSEPRDRGVRQEVSGQFDYRDKGAQRNRYYGENGER